MSLHADQMLQHVGNRHVRALQQQLAREQSAVQGAGSEHDGTGGSPEGAGCGNRPRLCLHETKTSFNSAGMV
ncbi:hypothetical protein [Paenibacillus tyrfis]|uniref:hypothetical protein n=1 Tax=Paenibacillus tyrfis TaxID=1501230 RepID=UPI001F281D73|nr:hypothetical protein [Paenibacillus tyrfis]